MHNNQHRAHLVHLFIRIRMQLRGKVEHSSSVMTVTGDTEMHLDVKLDDGSGMSLDMKYLGSCPADMAPGDYVSSTGMKINVLPSAQKDPAKP